jgi:hypothetical protein
MANELTQIRQQPPSQGFSPRSEAAGLSTELAKMLSLVAPVTMSADQQALWIASAVDALQDIRASEVADVSMEVRRSVTRPSQIVPEIAKLVGEKRARHRRLAELEPPKDALPPPPRHIMDRDRSTFKDADWAELSEHLEKVGSPVRYRSDGSRYTVTA